MYEELIKDLREWPRICVEYTGSLDELHDKAADAIEELSKREADMTHNMAALSLKVLRAEEKLPRWIPVTEQLPGRHKNVLCCGARGGMFVGWFTNISTISDGKTIAYVHGGNGRYVTHWMPLPQPPKEE